MRRLAAVLAAVVCTGVLAGCSQEPGPKPVKETAVLSKARFLERGNELCSRAERELDRRADDVELLFAGVDTGLTSLGLTVCGR